jgi:hypothetical protein
MVHVCDSNREDPAVAWLCGCAQVPERHGSLSSPGTLVTRRNVVKRRYSGGPACEMPLLTGPWVEEWCEKDRRTEGHTEGPGETGPGDRVRLSRGRETLVGLSVQFLPLISGPAAVRSGFGKTLAFRASRTESGPHSREAR